MRSDIGRSKLNAGIYTYNSGSIFEHGCLRQPNQSSDKHPSFLAQMSLLKYRIKPSQCETISKLLLSVVIRDETAVMSINIKIILGIVIHIHLTSIWEVLNRLENIVEVCCTKVLGLCYVDKLPNIMTNRSTERS
ncbi:hypothetical protein DPMN_137689 [Dreissena polymorpha]|uniref:Uncharacterized protein n=1 Tax=Dreissena polymorpha TaxID=45954 RepID=A0A9D4G2Z4_DREPO|nr:hypothetical protein DPMN_137689 [Dreissena polymorpha]